MALNNNVYFNAAYRGALSGMLSGRAISSVNPADYTTMRAVAVAIATAMDALIAFDALVTTGASNTELVDTASNTIQANTKNRPGLLQAIVQGVWSGRLPSSAAEATAATSTHAACFTLWSAALADCPSP